MVHGQLATTTARAERLTRRSLPAASTQDDPLNPYGTPSSSTRRWAATRPTPGTASTPTARWPASSTVQGTKVDPAAGTSLHGGRRGLAVRLPRRPPAQGRERVHRLHARLRHPRGSTPPAARGGSPRPTAAACSTRSTSSTTSTSTSSASTSRSEAPYVAELHRQGRRPQVLLGHRAYNSWDSNPDYSPEYWLSLPDDSRRPDAARRHRRQVQLEPAARPWTARSKVRTEDGRTFVQRQRHEQGHAPSPCARSCTSAHRLQPGRRPHPDQRPGNAGHRQGPRRTGSSAPARTRTAHWRYVTYDVDAEKLPGEPRRREPGLLHGDRAPTGSCVDFDHVNLEAKTQLTIPQFPEDTATTAHRRRRSSADAATLAATDVRGEVLRYAGVGAARRGQPSTRQRASSRGQPAAGRPARTRFQVAADDGDLHLDPPATRLVAADRQAAFEAALRATTRTQRTCPHHSPPSTRRRTRSEASVDTPTTPASSTAASGSRTR